MTAARATLRVFFIDWLHLRRVRRLPTCAVMEAFCTPPADVGLNGAGHRGFIQLNGARASGGLAHSLAAGGTADQHLGQGPKIDRLVEIGVGPRRQTGLVVFRASRGGENHDG